MAKKKFKAVEMSRKLRQEMSRKLARMSHAQQIEFLKKFSSAEVLRGKKKHRIAA